MTMKRVLVTGASGFVGYHLVELLLTQRVEIWGTFSSGRSNNVQSINWLSMDVTDPLEVDFVIKKIKPDVVFHLAAKSNVANSWINTNQLNTANINGTLNVVNSILNHSPDSLLVNIGSSEEYGIPTSLPINEKHILNPVNPYGISKLSAGLSVLRFCERFNLKVIHVRPFNHIGPGQSLGFVTSDFAKQIVDIETGNSPNSIHVGNLSSKRDFTDVRDVVKAYWLLSEYGKVGSVYNVCSGISTSISEILEKFILLSRKEIKIIVDPNKYRPIDVPVIFGDNHFLCNDTGWNRQYNLDKTVEDIMNYWRKKSLGELTWL
ncbi:GDP-mannose 4,6-dehydratase [Paenibacillus sp. ACRRX]|uniref:GDP-mannose 4,6-dehydratase n=1 Tax=Paenibacillus sp. ACRRX TaxID=2918206 RepID=UPI001EF66E44|nr:GDP-mannose 4,6-dehydratase [Paenibacillus sp. ACRRX]MCG7407943.1 GDP-mannose 4,6-dehydratase [Paenibacillus sp. ACRRX]